MAQQGYLQTHWQKSMEAFHPGMIASQMPKSIKTGLFMPLNSLGQPDASATLQFGVACGRAGADGMSVGTPNNFGEGTYDHGTRTDPLPRYASGGGAFVQKTIKYESTLVGTLHAAAVATVGAIAIRCASEDEAKRVQAAIHANDFLQILDSSNEQLEIMKVAYVGAVAGTGANSNVTVNVIRGTFGSSAVDCALGSKVNIFGRSHTYAGVVIKDLTLEGRYDAVKFDQFVYGDEIAVGMRGDYAVRVNDSKPAGGANTGVVIHVDDPVSVYIGDNTMDGKNGQGGSDQTPGTDLQTEDTGFWYGYFSNRPADHNHIVIPGARFVTEASDCNLYIRNSGTGWQPGHEINQTRRVAAVRFDSFA